MIINIIGRKIMQVIGKIEKFKKWITLHLTFLNSSFDPESYSYLILLYFKMSIPI